MRKLALTALLILADAFALSFGQYTIFRCTRYCAHMIARDPAGQNHADWQDRLPGVMAHLDPLQRLAMILLVVCIVQFDILIWILVSRRIKI